MKRIWTAVRYYVFLAIGLLLLYLVFKDVDLVWMWNEIKHANPYWIALSFFCGLIAMISRAWRWRIVLEPLGYRPPLLNCFNAVAIGYLTNIGLPRMGEVVRCTMLNQTDKVPVTQLIGTVILERVIDLLILISLIAVVVFAQFERFGSFFRNEVFGDKLDAILISLDKLGPFLYLILAFLIIGGFVFIRWFFARFGELGAVIKLKNLFKGIGDGFATLFKMKRKGAFLFHTFFIWFNYFLMTWVCVYAYEPTAALKAFDGLFLMVVGGLGMTAPVQGGFGAFHYLVEKALLLYNISPSLNAITGEQLRPGLVFATLVHSTQFIMTITAGIFALISMAFQRKKLPKLETS
ncbi:MAG: lysylphosphatidylglycerol synthase transmembrane domain-containing protein [Bacteroidia bacterium]